MMHAKIAQRGRETCQSIVEGSSRAATQCFADQRASTVSQRRLAEDINSSPQSLALQRLSQMANQSPNMTKQMRATSKVGASSVSIAKPNHTGSAPTQNARNSDQPVAQFRNHTEITYQKGTLNWRANNAMAGLVRQEPVGINSTAFLDPEDPEAGERTGAAPAGNIYTTPPAGHYANQNAAMNLTQGHLLNANLGGKAMNYNLFPITREMNRLHSVLVEDNVKHELLRIRRERITEGSLGLAAIPAPPALATSRGRAENQTQAPRAVANAHVAGTAIAAALPAAYLPLAMPPAMPFTAVAAATFPNANAGTVASHVITTAGNNVGATPAIVVAVANAVSGSLAGVAVNAPIVAAIGGTVGAAAGAATPVAAAAAIAGAIAAAPNLAGITGTFTATHQDIANAIATAPLAGLPAAGGGPPNWNNRRLFYNVRAEAPGLGAGVMRPVTLRQEEFHCTAYLTTNDGVTRDNNLGHLSKTIQAPQNLNNELAAIGFGPAAAPVGLTVGPQIAPGGGPGGIGIPGTPSQHNILDGGGNAVGHATLFNHG